MNQYFLEDYKSYYEENFSVRGGGYRLLTSYNMKLIYFGRKLQCSKWKISKRFWLVLLKHHGNKRGNEIHDFSRIGYGLKLGHGYNITLNPGVTIGNYCRLMKGCTLGSIRTGSNAGAPTLGDHVMVGLNSTIVGNVKIGNDVMIAANSFVNFDVPDHSVVIGNPGVIHHKENATEGY
ncbi:MAG: serine acetyltransferase [Lachnospiraceae bacterium]|nr:serine acetyltransferase [Lachnospiraceae bacterium]